MSKSGNLKTKPSLEKISPNFGSSFTVRYFDDPCANNEKFWHFHPEIEMVLIKSGNGKRHIGNHISYFQDGDLVLIGSNLPHSGFTNRLSGNQQEAVIQLLPSFLGEQFFDLPEMAAIQSLLQKSKLGISFHGETRAFVGELIDKLAVAKPFDRLILLLNIFQTLAVSEEYTLLNVDNVILEIQPQDNERINSVYKFVQENFTRPIALEEISKEVNLTVPSFSRYFKKITGKTFTQFVNEYRLVHASKLLAEKPIPISDVCYASGFNNFSHFTKQFKAFTGKSPSKYRNELKQMVS